MAFNVVRQVMRFGRRAGINNISQRLYSLYEPDYLQTGKSKIPLYPALNIKITGHAYSVLESYQSFIYKLSHSLDIDVDDSWALPPKELKVQRYKKGTAILDSEYKLSFYERNIQMAEVSSAKCSILVRLLEAVLPEGVSLKVEIYDPALEEKRYIPDMELLNLKSELSIYKRK